MNSKTPISALQELMAARRLSLPVYVEEDFGTSFKCTVYAAGVKAVGVSTSKKSAKHESAKSALDKLAAMSKPQQIVMLSAPCSPSENEPFKNYVGELNEFSSKQSLKYPNYDFISVAENGGFYFKCSFLGREALGKGMNKKDAKQNSAKKMLELIKSLEPMSTNDIYKLVQTDTKFIVENKEKIISMYNKLSLKEPTICPTINYSIKPYPKVNVFEYDNIDVLKAKLRQFGVNYTLNELQRDPFVMCVRLSGTDLYFIQSDENREEATKKVLQDVLEASKSGCSLNTNNLISFN